MLLKFHNKNRIKFIILFAVFTLTGICTNSQNLIGYKYTEIKNFMMENCRDMTFNNVTNNRFNYLKYSNSSDSQTILFFLDPDSVCRSIRMTCDFSIKEEKAREFSSKYKKNGNNRWIDSREGRDYRIEIKDEKWYYLITMERDK
jgi:hypothetical protein